MKLPRRQLLQLDTTAALPAVARGACAPVARSTLHGVVFHEKRNPPPPVAPIERGDIGDNALGIPHFRSLQCGLHDLGGAEPQHARNGNRAVRLLPLTVSSIAILRNGCRTPA